MDPPDEGAYVAPLWRCRWCDSQHGGEPPFEYRGHPVCSDGCEAALIELDEAVEELGKAIHARNIATIMAAVWFCGFLWAVFS
jgi:hypothetical protein